MNNYFLKNQTLGKLSGPKKVVDGLHSLQIEVTFIFTKDS